MVIAHQLTTNCVACEEFEQLPPKYRWVGVKKHSSSKAGAGTGVRPQSQPLPALPPETEVSTEGMLLNAVNAASLPFGELPSSKNRGACEGSCQVGSGFNLRFGSIGEPG